MSAAPLLDGRTAMVTGGGRGIGRAIARAFACAGARVGVVDLDASNAEEVAEGIRVEGGTAAALTCDVTSATDAEGCVQDLAGRFGPVDVLVNNAGGSARWTGIEAPLEDWQSRIELNLMSAVYTSRAVWASMRERGGGVILNAASRSATAADPNQSAYCVAKAGVVQLTRCMAVEGAPHGIRVNCVSPGFVQTPTLEAWISRMDSPEGARSRLLDKVPMERFASPEEVADAYLLLASDLSRYVTGVNLPVDGGAASQAG